MASPMLVLAQSPPPKATRSCSGRNLRCWSNLPEDLMQLVFERLSFSDFERAKSVCSSWLSASRQSQPTNRIPWMILFPKDTNSCLLFNPENKEKLYKTQHLGNEFAKSLCFATYRSWLLMQLRPETIGDNQYHFYILYLLTREKINLPTVALRYGLRSSTLWIDEKTKDFLIIGMLWEEDAISLKKGDSSWKQTPQLQYIDESSCIVYKDHKLYCLGRHELLIFDFSLETPQMSFEINVYGYVDFVRGGGGQRSVTPSNIPSNLTSTHIINNVVVRVSGDVLIVNSIRLCQTNIWSFEIYKVGSSDQENESEENEWEQISSLGDETILLDLGITVLAKDIKEIKRNSIYFNGCDSKDRYDENYIFIYDLDEKMVEQPPEIVCSSIRCSNARWFLPNFKR